MIYSVTDAVERMKKFCAYQERCQQDVRQKLKASLLNNEEREFVISELITQGFLNEERYARAFARGKFRINKWGRKKIGYALKAKGLSDYCIRMGLSEINQSEYEALIKREIIRYAKKYNGAALMRFLISHGFEAEILKKFIQPD